MANFVSVLGLSLYARHLRNVVKIRAVVAQTACENSFSLKVESISHLIDKK
jgi:hypothetical protein